jgi:hypothetical protein
VGLRYSRGPAGITVQASGTFDVDQIHATFSEIRDHISASDPARILILDSGSSFAPFRDGVKSFVGSWAELFDGLDARIALCVSRELHFGIGRQASVSAETWGLDFAVFRDESEAVAWLNSGESAV